jgi:hypothetical protein
VEEERKEQGKKYARMIAKAWSDEAFKERLINDPRPVLEAEGICPPKGVEIKVLEQTSKIEYIVIPMLPEGSSIVEAEERVAKHLPMCERWLPGV